MVEPDVREPAGCLRIAAGAILGAVLGATVALAIHLAFFDDPVPPRGPEFDPEGHAAAGFARAFEAVRAILIGLVPGALLGAAIASRPVRRPDRSRKGTG